MFGRRDETLQDRAEDLLEGAAEGLGEFGRDARRRADTAKKDVAKNLFSLADSLRREARERGASRDARRSVDDVARGLERAGTYLKKRSYEDIGGDIEEAVTDSQLPLIIAALIIGVVVGLLLSNQNNQGRFNG